MAGPATASYSFGTAADCHDRLSSPARSIGDHVELLRDDCSISYGSLARAPSPLPVNELSLQHYGPGSSFLPLLESAVGTSRPRVLERLPTIIGFITASPFTPVQLQSYPFPPENMSGPTTGPLNCNLQAPDIPSGPLIAPPSPLPPANNSAEHLPRACEGFDCDVSAFERQESFNFASFLDEISPWDDSLALSNMSPAAAMDFCNNQAVVAHVVAQGAKLESMVCDDSVGLQHFNQSMLPELQLCPTSSPKYNEGSVVFTASISGPILPMELSNVTPTSSVLYQTPTVHFEAPTLPAPFHGVTAELDLHESFYEGEDMGPVHGGNQAATRVNETEFCGRAGTLAWANGGQAGGIKPKEQARAVIAPSPFYGVTAEKGPWESAYEVEDGQNQTATRFNKTEFYREKDRLAWRKHGQAVGMKRKKQPRSTSISVTACGGVFEDEDHICDGKIVKLRVKTENIILDDGFFWFKYGQKQINGHTHPRSYLKCVESAWRGCKVQKRIQRCSSMEDFVEFLYLGRHNHSP